MIKSTERTVLVNGVLAHLNENDHEMCLDGWGTMSAIQDTLAALGKTGAVINDDFIVLSEPECQLGKRELVIEQDCSVEFAQGVADVRVSVPHIMVFDLDQPNRLKCPAWRALCAAVTSNRE